MGMVPLAALAMLVALAPSLAAAQDRSASVSLRLGGGDVPLPAAVSERIAALTRELVARCGPNTAQHPGNFGPVASQTEARLQRTLAASRLAVAFAPPVRSESALGGVLPVAEAVIGFEHDDLFVGPYFTLDDGHPVEHLQCGYLAALELACLAELSPLLPARYRETCAGLERGADGRILLPPPDIAPSCS